jgi:CRISPR-associated protein Cas1
MMMGKGFRRDADLPDINALLNYGYTVLRAATIRAVVAAGLHPTIGLFHSNRSNAFALADDLMEPFRPLVDLTARAMAETSGPEVSPQAKGRMADLIALDLPLTGETSPVAVALSRLAVSLAQSFESRQLRLILPTTPAPLVLAGLGR